MQLCASENAHAKELIPVLLEQIGTNERFKDEFRRLSANPCFVDDRAHGGHVTSPHRIEHRLEPCPFLRIGCWAHAASSAMGVPETPA